MTSSCPVTLDAGALHERVRAEYERLATAPEGRFHFSRGLRYAVDVLGYDEAELASLPRIATERFAGVGNPLAIGPIRAGETVLDIGCGGGTDLLLAARRVGPEGRVIGVDMTPEMRASAMRAALEARCENIVEIRAGLAEELPASNETVDVVISNGVLNLAVDKERVLREVFRVLEPGGRLYLADVAVEREFSPEVRGNVELWAACVAGALTESEFVALAAKVGLVDARVTARFASFEGTGAGAQVRADMHLRGVNVVAYKPQRGAARG
jgi:SAM-dependent methyltransferase